MTTALYRLSSNRVHAISEQNQVWEFDDEFFAMLFDPDTPDGTQTREITLSEDGRHIFGPENVLGHAKTAVPGSNLLRNATQEEAGSRREVRQGSVSE
jgi:hypothetical protein